MPQGLLVVPIEWLQRNIAARIERMAGLTGGVEAQGIDHLEAAEAPALGKAHQPPQGGIVALANRPRRIKADEEQSWRRRNWPPASST